MELAARYAEVRARGGIADLSARTKLRLTGADRVRYLNGQVTNDVRKLQPGVSLYACVTTAKGKLSADVQITAGPDFLLVDADPSLRESLLARLERYIIADDVTIEDVTDSVALLHLLREGNPSALPELTDGAVVTSRRVGIAGADLFFPSERKPEILDHLSTERREISEELLEILRIEAGVPRWGFELGEDTLPPEAGLDLTAIDYHKGCYIGQEVISRIKSVGHVNKELRGFVAPDGAKLTPDMLLFHGEKPAGRLTSTTHSFGLERPVALGYLKRGIEAETLTARTAAGENTCTVEVKALPLVA